MTTYYLDDGGSNTSPYDTWAKAANALSTLTALAGSGDIIKMQTDHQEIGSAADLNIDGVASGDGPIVIKVDKDNSDAYDPDGATVNFQTTTGNYEIDVNNGIQFYGVRFDSNERLQLGSDIDAPQRYIDCKFTVGAADWITIGGNSRFFNCVFDSNDSSNTSTELLRTDGLFTYLEDCSIGSTAGTYRDLLFGAINNGLMMECVGCDFSALTRNPVDLMEDENTHDFVFYGCKMPTNLNVFTGTNDVRKSIELLSCSAKDSAELYAADGSCIEEASIVRTGGSAKSFELTTNANAGKVRPMVTPWIYGVVDSTGSKNFDIYYTSDSQLDEEQLYIELELFDSASTPLVGRETTLKRAILGDTVGNHTSGGTWGGTAKTYKEYMRLTATVNAANTLVRARVACEVTSQTTEVYVDRKIEIS